MVPFDRWCTSSCSGTIVCVALSCIVSEIKQDIDQKSRFFTTPEFDGLTPLLRCERRTLVVIFGIKVSYGITRCKNIDEKFNVL